MIFRQLFCPAKVSIKRCGSLFRGRGLRVEKKAMIK